MVCYVLSFLVICFHDNRPLTTFSAYGRAFDKPRSFVKLFDRGMQKDIIDIVNRVRENAVRVTG